MHTVRRVDLVDMMPVADGEMDTDVAVLQSVGTGETLFQPGDQRRVYRVEQGAICHYILWSDGSHDMIEVAFPGDLVGLGYLGTHVSTAQAMVPTVVSLVSDADFHEALETDDRLAFLLAGAGEREFDYMRDASVNAGKGTPVGRLANYLVAVAAVETGEGRTAGLVNDDLASGFVAQQLQMSVDALQSALLGLEKKGLLSATDKGLRILDLAELEKVASA